MLPLDIVRVAAERGMQTIAFTDHWYPSSDIAIIDGTRAAVSDAQRQLGTSLKVFYGCEAEIMSPGATSASAELAKRLDFVMVAATYFCNKPMTVLPDGDDDFHARYFLRMFEFGVSLPWVSVMAHPFNNMHGFCSNNIFKIITDSDLIPGIEAAAENAVAMEISRRMFASQEQYRFLINFYGLCRKSGVKFTLGSDAHRLKDVAQIHLLQPVIEELGLAEEDFWRPSSPLTANS
jgi:histidinol phosphatase-like PHP family hydrolase